MTPLDLLRTSDAAVLLAGVACLVGWLVGVWMVLLLGWRRLTHPIDGSVIQLRRDYDDALRRLEEQAQVVDAQTAQIGQLYKDGERLARLYADAAAGMLREHHDTTHAV